MIDSVLKYIPFIQLAIVDGEANHSKSASISIIPYNGFAQSFLVGGLNPSEKYERQLG